MPVHQSRLGKFHAVDKGVGFGVGLNTESTSHCICDLEQSATVCVFTCKIDTMVKPTFAECEQ